MKYLDIRAERSDNGLHLGVTMALHRHGFTYRGGIVGRMHPAVSDLPPCPIHFHLLLDFLYWYVEFTIGKQDPDDAEEEA